MKKHSQSALITLTIIAASVSFLPALAGNDRVSGTMEFQASASDNNTPLWLNANKYGLSCLQSLNAYARGTVYYNDVYKPWNVSYTIGSDLVLPLRYWYTGYNESEYHSTIILQQLYVDVRWRKALFTIGAKQQPAELRDNLLSSGAQTFGINARPVPQGRLAMADWWSIPRTNDWLAVKGHIAYGIMSDADWEEAFVGTSGKTYNRWTRYHEKAGYIRIGKEEKFPLTLTVGLEMAAQFGGTLYNYRGTDQNGYRGSDALKLKSDIRSYWNAFIPGGGDTNETEFKNAEGNQVGSWLLRFNWEAENISIGLYGDHFFEDHSSMFFLDYNGYGEGEHWKEKQKLKFFVYDLRDGQLGLDFRLKNFRWIEAVTLEFMNTKYQSGPVYHDRNSGNSDHIGGIDDYYNHSTLPGWQHWGQAIGNPLYRSPQYNTDGYIYFEHNRFTAWHGGVRGSLADKLDYRLLLTWQKSFGGYRIPTAKPIENTSFMAELTYQMPENCWLRDFKLCAAYGMDKGNLLGDNQGVQITIQYKLK